MNTNLFCIFHWFSISNFSFDEVCKSFTHYIDRWISQFCLYEMKIELILQSKEGKKEEEGEEITFIVVNAGEISARLSFHSSLRKTNGFLENSFAFSLLYWNEI